MRECFICKEAGNHVDFYCSVDGYDYIRCHSCGLVYVDVIEDWDKLYKSYSGGVWKSFRRKLMAPLRKLHHYKNYKASIERAESIIAFAKLQSKNGHVVFLDVGCNKCFLLSAAIEKNSWEPYGVEVVEELTVPFKNKYRMFSGNVLSSKLHESGSILKNNMFDVITAIDVIEHFEDPLRDMKTIFNILKEDGIFIIQTPDTSCYQAKEEKAEWGGLKPLEHLFLFDKKNLMNLSKMIGYKTISFYECFEEADGNFVAVFEK